MTSFPEKATPPSAIALPPPGPGVQATLEDLGTPLDEVTFVVVDLETTGAGPGAHAITEIGAVRVRGGQIRSELATLVNPGAAIPAQVTVLTGITNAMVLDAPPVASALTELLGWARLDEPDTVLVAHNARFDVGHLRGASRALGLAWTEPRVLDTLALARKAWGRDEVPNHRLGTLASYVRTSTAPTHRALDDARATVDVLHAALERMAPLGVTHLEDLATATDPVPAARRAKARLADGLPTTPGVYQFLSPAGQVLYVGTAVNLRRRVRSYFTASETRGRIARMLDTSVRVQPVPCATVVEARVRELRLIAELDPPLNRRSRAPQRQPWLRLDTRPSPHVAMVTALSPQDATEAIGPFASRRVAQEARRAVESVLRGRQADGTWDPASDAVDVEGVRAALGGRCDVVAAPLMERVRELAAAERFEEAGVWTERLRAFLRGVERAERLRPLLACPHLTAARRRPCGGWELVAVRWGRLAGSAVTPPGADPRPAVAALRATAEVVERPVRVGRPTSAEETLLLADWVEAEGTRLVEVDSAVDSAGEGDVGTLVDTPLTWPVAAAARHARLLTCT